VVCGLFSVCYFYQPLVREAKTFNQDIGNWNVGNVNAMTGMLRDAKLKHGFESHTLRIDCCTDECVD
jgi:hypothetical protein